MTKRRITKFLQRWELENIATKKKKEIEQSFKLLENLFGREIAGIISDYNNHSLEEVRLFYFHETEINSLTKFLPIKFIQ